jgi:type IV pilus assembly protein PilV
MNPISGSRSTPKRLRGTSLIEVLVAIVVLSTGLLGMVALQAKALRNNQSALERSQGVVYSYSIIDRMHSNLTNIASYARALGDTTPTGTDLASVDVAAWLGELRAALGSAADASIVLAGNVATITVQWQDTRATRNQNSATPSSTMSITTKVRL